MNNQDRANLKLLEENLLNKLEQNFNVSQHITMSKPQFAAYIQKQFQDIFGYADIPEKPPFKRGDFVYTPRFCNVEISAIYGSKAEAYKNEFTEPTHYKKIVDGVEYTILGKSLDLYHMRFALVRLKCGE